MHRVLLYVRLYMYSTYDRDSPFRTLGTLCFLDSGVNEVKNERENVKGRM